MNSKTHRERWSLGQFYSKESQISNKAFDQNGLSQFGAVTVAKSSFLIIRPIASDYFFEHQAGYV